MQHQKYSFCFWRQLITLSQMLCSTFLTAINRIKNMTILLLAGSPSAPSRSTRLLHHVGEKLALLGHSYTKIDVRDLPADALLRADFKNVEIQAALARLEQVDAVVIATPVYKAAYSGVLKAGVAAGDRRQSIAYARARLCVAAGLVVTQSKTCVAEHLRYRLTGQLD
jgi:NAD(P)H-dependent FMN reductase